MALRHRIELSSILSLPDCLARVCLLVSSALALSRGHWAVDPWVHARRPLLPEQCSPVASHGRIRIAGLRKAYNAMAVEKTNFKAIDNTHVFYTKDLKAYLPRYNAMYFAEPVGGHCSC